MDIDCSIFEFHWISHPYVGSLLNFEGHFFESYKMFSLGEINMMAINILHPNRNCSVLSVTDFFPMCGVLLIEMA